jgi:hypothetical protein
MGLLMKRSINRKLGKAPEPKGYQPTPEDYKRNQKEWRNSRVMQGFDLAELPDVKERPAAIREE